MRARTRRRSTKVDVTLPEGLTYSSHDTATGTYADGVWSIGELAVTNDDNPATNDDSPTLTITATVDAGTHGQDLTVKAAIYSTEAVEVTEDLRRTRRGRTLRKLVTHHVRVPDPIPGNNTAMGTVTVVPLPNVDPMFIVGRSVPESSPAGTNCGRSR